MTDRLGRIPVADLDLRLLRVFRTVVELGGLKAAQTTLGVGLPTISKQLTDLEIRLGVRLCRRGQRFELTPEGVVIHKAALALFAGLERFEDEVAEVRRGHRGEIRIGIIDNTISDPRSPLVDALGRLDAGDLHVRLSVLDPDAIEQRVLDGRLDLGILPLYRERLGLEYRSIYTEQMHLYCGCTHPLFERGGTVGPEEIERLAFVQHGYVDGASVDGFPKPATMGATAWQVEAVAMLIMTGRFVGYLPTHYADALVRAGSIGRILAAQDGYRSDVVAAFRPVGARSSAVNRLLRSLEQCVSARRLHDRHSDEDAASTLSRSLKDIEVSSPG